jgi:hypothetical protein
MAMVDSVIGALEALGGGPVMVSSLVLRAMLAARPVSESARDRQVCMYVYVCVCVCMYVCWL